MRTWQENAREFAELDAGEGWPFAVLVACSVERGIGQGALRRDRDKVSGREFAELAGTSADRVLRYLDGWERAADAGAVPHSAELAPQDAHTTPTPDVPWTTFYDASRAGGRPRDVRAADAVTIIERRGADDVVAEMTQGQRRDLYRALNAATIVESEAETIAAGGRVGPREPSASMLDPVIEAVDAFERASVLQGRVFALLRDYPPTNDVARDRVRQWAVGLVDLVTESQVTR